MTYRFPDVLCSRVSFRLSVSQVDSRVILRGRAFLCPPFLYFYFRPIWTHVAAVNHLPVAHIDAHMGDAVRVRRVIGVLEED